MQPLSPHHQERLIYELKSSWESLNRASLDERHGEVTGYPHANRRARPSPVQLDSMLGLAWVPGNFTKPSSRKEGSPKKMNLRTLIKRNSFACKVPFNQKAIKSYLAPIENQHIRHTRPSNLGGGSQTPRTRAAPSAPRCFVGGQDWHCFGLFRLPTAVLAL